MGERFFGHDARLWLIPQGNTWVPMASYLQDVEKFPQEIAVKENKMNDNYDSCLLYEAVAILFDEDSKGGEKKPQLILGPIREICKSREEMKIKVIRLIDKKYEDKITKIKVFVRPFA